MQLPRWPAYTDTIEYNHTQTLSLVKTVQVQMYKVVLAGSTGDRVDKDGDET